MRYSIEEILSIDQLKKITNALNKAFHYPAAITKPDGVIISSTTEFESFQNSIEINSTVITEKKHLANLVIKVGEKEKEEHKIILDRFSEIIQVMISSELKEKDSSLRNKLIRKLFLANPDNIAVLKKDNLKYVLVNEYLANSLGYCEKEMLGKTPFELNIWSADSKLFVEELEGQKKIDNIEIEFTTKSNKKIYGIVYAHRLIIDNEELILAIVKEFSNQKKNLSLSLGEERRYRKFLEALPDILFRVNEKGVFIDCYTNSTDNLIVPANEITGANIKDILPGDIYKLTVKNLKTTLKNKRPGIYEYCIVTEGKEKWFEARMIPYSDSEVLVIIRNITESKKDKIALYESEQKFKNLTENLLGVTYISNNDKKYTMKFLTKNIQKLCGYEVEEFLSQKIFFSDIIHPLDYKFVREEINKSEAKTGGFQIRYRILTKDDKVKWVDESGLVVKNKNGSTHIEGYILDVTEDLEKENQLREYRIELEKLVEKRTGELDQINKELIAEIEKTKKTKLQLKKSLEKEKEYSELKSRFISTASHEFRTPLTTILSSIDLIDLFIYNNKLDETPVFVDKIRKSVGKLTTLIDDILILNKTEGDFVLINPTPVDVKSMISQIINEIDFLTKGNISVQFKTNITGNEKYLIDEKLYSLVCTNLISNAFKYSPEGGEIKIKLIYKKECLIFTIKDEGIGIEEKDIPHIFEQFHRGKNTKNIQGTGLGLSIVNKALELLKGNIKVKSVKNCGSKFRVEIPVGRSQDV